MRLIVETLLQSIKELGEILILSCFFYLIFAILGVSLWHGVIHNRCVTSDNGSLSLVPDDNRVCGSRSCEVGDCEYFVEDDDPFKHTKIEELNYGFTTFDNVGNAFLTIFQTTTAEGWTDIMEIYADGYTPVIVYLYFIFCVIICNFFILNTTVAIMLDKYLELKDNNATQSTEAYEKIGMDPKLVQRIVHMDLNFFDNNAKSRYI